MGLKLELTAEFIDKLDVGTGALQKKQKCYFMKL